MHHATPSATPDATPSAMPEASRFPAARHDHDACMRAALAGAEAVCRRADARLTPLRRRVLELVWRRHAPVGAYDLLRTLAVDHPNAAPPTVYRALDFLRRHGLVHRVESLNAFVGCPDPSNRHPAHFLICDGCGRAAEFADAALANAIAGPAARADFQVRHTTVEVHGLCPVCQASDSLDAQGAKRGLDATGRASDEREAKRGLDTGGRANAGDRPDARDNPTAVRDER